jgi:hypothetical protein
MGNVPIDCAGADLKLRRKVFGPADASGAHLVHQSEKPLCPTHPAPPNS